MNEDSKARPPRTRCPGSALYVGWNTPRHGPDRADCPICGRIVSFHRITGHFARHNQPQEDTPVKIKLSGLDHTPLTADQIEAGENWAQHATDAWIAAHPGAVDITGDLPDGYNYGTWAGTVELDDERYELVVDGTVIFTHRHANHEDH